MKLLLRRLALTVAAVALLVPAVPFGDEMPLPLEKKVLPGTSTVSYLGQTIRFTTLLPLLVRCQAATASQFDMTVTIYPGTPPPPGGASSYSETLQIYWVNYGDTVYQGAVPTTPPWVGTFNTEGGFIDR